MDDPYKPIRDAQRRASRHAGEARELVTQAANTSDREKSARLSELSRTHSLAALATMAADGCISVQDLKR